MSLFDPLSDELLYLFVLGPGTGETVLLRIPPDLWVVVDSFRCAGRAAAEFVLAKHKGQVAAIVLTHPHQDHYDGIVELIDAHPGAILGCVHPRESGPITGPPADASAHLRLRARATYVRIWDEWRTNEARRWWTFRRESRVIGSATVTSLHPGRPIAPDNWSTDPNAISSAMLVEWKSVRLVLGADVPNSQWPHIAAEFSDLGVHAVLKVPHHGSREAIHDTYGAGDRNRCWAVTPFHRQGLPRSGDFAGNGDPEGLASILAYVDEIHLTGLPFSHDHERQPPPCITTRAELRDRTRPQFTGPLPEGFCRTVAALDRHVVVGLDPGGIIRDRRHGPGTVLCRS
jgi:Metallo-beta-lactamase superfamily